MLIECRSEVIRGVFQVFYGCQKDSFVGRHQTFLKEAHVGLDELSEDRVLLHNHVRVKDKTR